MINSIAFSLLQTSCEKIRKQIYLTCTSLSCCISDGALGNQQTFCTIFVEDGNYLRELRWSVTEVCKRDSFSCNTGVPQHRSWSQILKGKSYVTQQYYTMVCDQIMDIKAIHFEQNWTISLKIASSNPNMFNKIFIIFPVIWAVDYWLFENPTASQSEATLQNPCYPTWTWTWIFSW